MAAKDPPPDSYISPHASLTYWNAIPADVNGMLGGFPQISRIDLQGSRTFLAKLRRQFPSTSSNSSPISTSTSSTSTSKLLPLGVDCGAGIGRVTEGFLSKVCEVVDVVEPVEKFAREIREGRLKAEGKVGDVYVVGLEDWGMNQDEDGGGRREGNEKGGIVGGKKYDLIWNQWCLGHLTDAQLIDYLHRCKTMLQETGWLVVKENMSTHDDGEDIFDELDSSVTRTDGKFRELFRTAGWRVWKSEVQAGFPEHLYPVRFYALRPEG